MFFLGVDGGGTKTKFVLINKKLEVCSIIETTTAHIFQVGKQGIVKILKKGVNEIINEANIKKEDIKYVVLGMPGYTELKNNDIEIEQAVKEIFNFTKYYICNDAEIGWAGSLACQPGISIVAGTGSIGFAIDSERNKFRTGGWGNFIGDEGSAHWISKKALEIYSKQKDSRLPPSILLDIIEKEYNVKQEYEMINIIHNKYKLDRRQIAKLSVIVFKAAKEGCPYSRDIFNEAAYELYLHVEALIKKTNFKEPILLSYAGGVFKSGELIIKPFKELINGLKMPINLIEPKMEPSFGAAFYAYLLHECNTATAYIVDKMVKNIKKTILED